MYNIHRQRLSALLSLLAGYGVQDVAAQSTASAPPAASTPPSVTPSVSVPDALVPPRLLQESQPEYPAAAKEKGIAATVVLELDIDAEGHVENASVAEASETPEYGFEAAALAAAKLLEFAPATEAGKTIPVRIGYRFRFVPESVSPVLPSPTEVPQISAAPPAAAAKSKSENALPKGELSGLLQERGTRLPLSGVKITVFRGEGETAEGFETETDPEGKFRVLGLGPGQWHLLADPDGYFPVRTTEEVNGNSRTDVKYIIERGSYNPYDVEVDTQRVKREVNHIAMDARQAERIPGTFGDVLAVVGNFPGVARPPAFSFDGGFAIRGSAPKDSRILVNGVDVPLLYHFGGIRSVLPSGMLEKVNFYPGNFSVEYGRATGGIIDVDLRNLKRRNVGGYADINLMDASLYLEVPVTEKLSFALAGRRSYIDTVLNAALSGGGNSVLAPRYYDTQALVSFQPAAEHQIKGFFFYSNDLFKVLFKDPVVADTSVVIKDIGLTTNFYRGMLEYQYVPNARFENKLKLSFGRDQNAFNLGEAIKTTTDLYQLQARDAARYAFNDALALRAGVDYLYQRRNVDATVPRLQAEGGGGSGQPSLSNTQSATTSNSYHSLAGFAELELKPWQGMLAVPGVRFDYFGRTKKTAVSPRISLRQALSPAWALKGGVGLFQQEPTFAETDKAGGNPKLGTEKAIHYSAGFEYTPKPFLNLSITGFYKTLYDTVGATDAVTSVNGETVPVNYSNEAKGRAMGLEVSARHDLHENLFAWVAYTLSKSERKDPGATSYRLFDYDQTHILTVMGSYRLPRNWEIGARFRYVTGNLYTPVTGAVYDADKDEYASSSGKLNSGRVQGFHQLDIRIDKRWVYESWMLNAYLDIQNVYNQVNVENLDYNYDFSKSVPQQGLPLIPVLGLRGEF